MTENTAPQQQLPNQTLTRVVPCTLDRSGKLTPIAFIDGKLPVKVEFPELSELEITTLPSVEVESLPYVPVPAHLFALINESLKLKLSGSGTMKIRTSSVNILAGAQTPAVKTTAATNTSDIVIVTAVATGTTFVTNIAFTNNTAGALDFILTIGTDVVLTLYQIPANKSVILTPSGIVTY